MTHDVQAVVASDLLGIVQALGLPRPRVVPILRHLASQRAQVPATQPAGCGHDMRAFLPSHAMPSSFPGLLHISSIPDLTSRRHNITWGFFVICCSDSCEIHNHRPRVLTRTIPISLMPNITPVPPPPWNYIAKLVCIGDSGGYSTLNETQGSSDDGQGTGKSSLTVRLCEGRFSTSHDVTIGKALQDVLAQVRTNREQE